MGETGLCIVVTGPSGVGKTTVVERLLATLRSAARLVTVTTRAPREGERDGVDYHFLSCEDFLARRDRGELLEWEEVYPGGFYGSFKADLARLRSTVAVTLCVVDVAGAEKYRKLVPDALCVMLVAPAAQIEGRIMRRSRGEPPEKIAQRVRKVAQELTYAERCDVTVDCVDGELEAAVSRITGLIAGRLRETA